MYVYSADDTKQFCSERVIISYILLYFLINLSADNVFIGSAGANVNIDAFNNFHLNADKEGHIHLGTCEKNVSCCITLFNVV